MEQGEEWERHRAFYSHVREWIISLLLAVVLYLASYWLVARYKKHKTREDCYSGEEDAMVYRITTWLCSFAVCVSLGSALLLPVSIVTNELLLHYPDSAYMQWLNTSLIQGLWNQVFLGCNVSLLLLLPFAYFFTESAGLAGSRKVTPPPSHPHTITPSPTYVLTRTSVALQSNAWNSEAQLNIHVYTY